VKRCYKCGHNIETESISFKDECPECRSDLHVCLNCMFYDEGKANRCREPQTDYVKERDRSNFCEYFRFNDAETKKPGKEEAEKMWAMLFKSS